MDDLYLGFAILAAASLVAFQAALRLDRRAPHLANLVTVTVFSLMGWYTVSLWQTAAMTRLLPYSNVIVLGNWFPPAAAFLAGILWRRSQFQPTRRGLLAGGLAMAASYSTVYPLLGEHPSCRDSWSGNVCMQTSRNTCSAASAATLLKFAGIEASESEMAELCLTRRGTTWAGLYRGLKQKTAGTGWDVEIFDATIDDLRASRQPVLLSVGLKEAPRVNDDYVNDWGWVPGQSHSVVLLNFLGRDTVVIGDPAVGRELWSVKDLAVLWQGEGIRLVRSSSGHQLAQRHFE